MERLKLFHRDVLTIRSHQWKYYVESYSGCALRCTYCLYWKSPGFVSELLPPEDLVEGVERDLASMPRKQIVYVGSIVDPYQWLEKKVRSTRSLLEVMVRRGVPVVILTKSPLILRDLDLLLELNRQGLVLVQFTVLTTNAAKARAIERGAPPVAERLKAAAELSAAGIPVHFHLSPVVPGLYEDGELPATVEAIAAHGGQCIYSNILGMRHLNTRVWFDSVEQVGLKGADETFAAYARVGDPRKNVYSPDVALIFSEMSRLSDICRTIGIDFICEFIPGLDAFDPARFERGLFRFGLPAVYQMARVFDTPPGRKDWTAFSAALSRRFDALDDEYLALVKQFWDDGQLFANTTIGSEVVDGQRVHFQTDHLHLAEDTVLAWD